MKTLAAKTTVQGNLDPMLLVAGGHLLESRVREIMETLKDTRHIVNLGHGILQQTPIDNVAWLVQLVRE
jgi:uroporphyrinogen decarboxylase